MSDTGENGQLANLEVSLNPAILTSPINDFISAGLAVWIEVGRFNYQSELWKRCLKPFLFLQFRSRELDVSNPVQTLRISLCIQRHLGAESLARIQFDCSNAIDPAGCDAAGFCIWNTYISHSSA